MGDIESGEVSLIRDEIRGTREVLRDNGGRGDGGTELGDFGFQLADGFFVYLGSINDRPSEVLSHCPKVFGTSVCPPSVEDVEGRAWGDEARGALFGGTGRHWEGFWRGRG